LRRLLLASVCLIVACGPSRRSCPAGFVGDPKQPPQAVVLWTDGLTDQLSELTDGQALLLEPPPQGGYVMYVGAKVKNMDGCGIEFRGRLRDAVTNEEVGFDARSSDLMLGSDGFGYPKTGVANVSNVNGCPQVSNKDIQGQVYNLEMTVVDRDMRTVVVTHPVTPTCMLSDPNIQQHCVCTCSANYSPGKCGFGDGGM
jgi:hypothetical protein